MNKYNFIIPLIGLVFAINCSAALNIESVTPNTGPADETWTASVKGSGFDEQTYLSLFRDGAPEVARIYSIELPEYAHSLTVSGTTACVGTQEGNVYIVDITNPEEPLLIGEIGLDVSCWAMEISGEKLLIAGTGDKGGKLSVIDISIPAQPWLVGEAETDSCYALAVSGETVYLAGDKINIVDIAVPSKPTVVGVVDTPWVAYHIAVSGTRAVVSGGQFHAICIDVSRPEAPWVISTLPNPSQEPNSQPEGFVVSGGYIFLTGWDGIYILDIHSSTQISIAGHVDTRNSESSRISVSGDKICFVGDQDDIYLMDISEPLSPKLLGHVGASGNATDLAISGDWVFEPDGRELIIYNIANLKPPNAIDTVYTTNDVRRVVLLGDYAYVASSWSGGRIYKIDLVKNAITAGIELDPIYRIFVSEERVYGVTKDGIYVIDNTQPDRLELGQHINFENIVTSSTHWQRIEIEDNDLYVMDGTSLKVLSIMDLKNPPEMIGAVELPEGSFLRGCYRGNAYIANGHEVYVVGPADSVNPSLLYTLTFPDTEPGYIDSVCGFEDKVYFATIESSTFCIDDFIHPDCWTDYYLSGLYVHDSKKDHTNLEYTDITNACYSNSDSIDMEVHDNVIYISPCTDGICVANISNPDRPFTLGPLHEPAISTSGGFSVSGDRAYIAHPDYGLVILSVPYEIDTFSIIDATEIMVTIPPLKDIGAYTIRATSNDGFIDKISAFSILPNDANDQPNDESNQGDNAVSNSSGGCFIQNIVGP